MDVVGAAAREADRRTGGGDQAHDVADVLGEPVDVRRRPRHAQQLRDHGVAARRAADAEVDATRGEGLERRELLGDHERGVVGQHDAARADADAGARARRRRRSAPAVSSRRPPACCGARRTSSAGSRARRRARRGRGMPRPPARWSARCAPARGRGRTGRVRVRSWTSSDATTRGLPCIPGGGLVRPGT